jgi:hypothetical protein
MSVLYKSRLCCNTTHLLLIGSTSASELPEYNTCIYKSADTTGYMKQNAYFKLYILYELLS